MNWRRLGGGVLLVALTIVLAPLLFAAGKGLLAAMGETDRGAQSFALLAAYRDHRPPDISLANLDVQGEIRDCGYDEERLFSPGDRGPIGPHGRWTQYGGYFDLFLWRRGEWRERGDDLRLDLLTAQTSAFSSEFLRICMRQSLLAPLCAGRVHAILDAAQLDSPDSVPASSRIDETRWNRTICAYLDGVAARNGQPLATQPANGAQAQ
jgi:hypothetical protein